MKKLFFPICLIIGLAFAFAGVANNRKKSYDEKEAKYQTEVATVLESSRMELSSLNMQMSSIENKSRIPIKFLDDNEARLDETRLKNVIDSAAKDSARINGALVLEQKPTDVQVIVERGGSEPAKLKGFGYQVSIQAPFPGGLKLIGDIEQNAPLWALQKIEIEPRDNGLSMVIYGETSSFKDTIR